MEPVEKKIWYLCDRKACGEKHDCRECRYTSNIEHAKDFEFRNGRYWQRQKRMKRLTKHIANRLRALMLRKKSLDELS